MSYRDNYQCVKPIDITESARRAISRASLAGDCWVLERNRDTNGRPRLAVSGRMRTAARVIWEARFGLIPDDMHVCHRCDNPACIRPEHLFLGTSLDNMRDKVAKGRSNTVR